MTTFKSQSTTKVGEKEFIPIKAENQSEINQIRNFSKKIASKQKTFIGGILASKSNKQNKKDLVASDNFDSNSIFSSKQQIKETTTQSAESSTEEKQPVEEIKETTTQSAESPEVHEGGKNANEA